MTGKFKPGGDFVGATILEVPVIKILDMRTKQKNGYSAVRLEVAGKKSPVVKEVRTEETYEPGTEINLQEMVKVGDKVKISGISKGKGFAGPVKRYNFKGGPRTHGQSDRERSPGSSGSTTTPGRVFPGTRRGGRMGMERISIKGLTVLELDWGKRIMVVSGGIPGAGGQQNLITITVK